MSKKNKNFGAKIWLILSQIFVLITLLPWFAVFGLSFMAFDAGFSVAALIFVLVIACYPIAAIVFSVLAWKKYKAGDVRRAVVFGSIPVIAAIVFMLFII